MRLLIDVDNTVFNTNEAFISFSRSGGINVKKAGDEEVNEAAIKFISSKNYKQSPLIQDAKEIILMLYLRGHRIYLTRSFGVGDWKNEFDLNNKILFDTLSMVAKHKIINNGIIWGNCRDILLDNRIDMFITNDIELLPGVVDKCIPVLFGRREGKINNLFTIPHWRSFANFINNECFY